MKFTPLGKLVVMILAIGVGFGVWRYWNRLAPSAATKTSGVVPKIDLPSGEKPSGQSGNVSPITMSVSSEAGCTDKPEVRLLGYAWNAQMGMHLANGGVQATKGSLMCRHGVNLHFSRQDDNGKLQEALIAFATELSQGTSQRRPFHDHDGRWLGGVFERFERCAGPSGAGV